MARPTCCTTKYSPAATNIEAVANVLRRRLRDFLGRSIGPKQRIPVVLWGKPDCSLCDKAEAILGRVARDFPLDVEKRDINSYPEVLERYRYVIPVVQFLIGPTLEGKITEHRIRRILVERGSDLGGN